MITTEEASLRLGVTRRRVQELARIGALSAQKISGVWLVDEASVDERLRSVSKRGGRPLRGSGGNETSFTLMNRTHEVASVVYDSARKEFSYVGADVDSRRAPIGVASPGGVMSRESLNAWWRGRGIPQMRRGLATLLDEAGVKLPQELIRRNLGLSLSDQYWICPVGSGLAWEDVNFFDNDFEQVSLITAEYAPAECRAPAKPDNTSDGNLEKVWVCRDGIRCLLKKGALYGQEPCNEAVATALHRRLLAEGAYVPYRLEGEGAQAVSCCPNFLANEEEYVPAYYVKRLAPRGSQISEYEHYLACCDRLGVSGAKQALDRMIVCDDIIANHDRHWRNFGIVRNVETLACRPAPLFDSGSSLWCDVETSVLVKGERSFKSSQFYESPAKQMLLVDDLEWFDAAALDGFVDEAIGILSANDALTARIPHLRAALEWRVERMRSIAAWG